MEGLKSLYETSSMELMCSISKTKEKIDELTRLRTIIQSVTEQHEDLIAVYLNTFDLMFKKVEELEEVTFTLVVNSLKNYDNIRALFEYYIPQGFSNRKIKINILKDYSEEEFYYGNGILLFSKIEPIYRSEYIGPILTYLLCLLQDTYNCKIDIQEDMCLVRHNVVYITINDISMIRPIKNYCKEYCDAYSYKVNEGNPEGMETSTYFMFMTPTFNITDVAKTTPYVRVQPTETVM